MKYTLISCLHQQPDHNNNNSRRTIPFLAEVFIVAAQRSIFYSFKDRANHQSSSCGLWETYRWYVIYIYIAAGIAAALYEKVHIVFPLGPGPKWNNCVVHLLAWSPNICRCQLTPHTRAFHLPCQHNKNE